MGEVEEWSACVCAGALLRNSHCPHKHTNHNIKYSSGAFAASGLFYVAGGQATDDFLLPSVECFDPRAGRWRLLPASIEQGVGLTRVDLAMMYTLF